MSIVVTGGAGFIGSCMVRTLNDKGIDDIIIVDNIASTDKWMNMRNKKYREYVHKSVFLERLKENVYPDIEAIIHLGACSSTTEKNFDYLWNNNFEYTKTLWKYCGAHDITFLYASSAATYGDGSLGFDDRMDIDKLSPLNGYGYSKQLFDLWVKRVIANEEIIAEPSPAHYAGFKFFNVYGPNEYFKGSMASMIFHGYRQIMEHRRIRLFQSCRADYKDGEQLRDFVYVKDVCDVIWYFLDECKTNGLFNIGTGRAQSFRELAEATFYALGQEPQIEYIPMPEQLREKYQYYTQANIEKLRATGYDKTFCDLKSGAEDYVKEYLEKDFMIY
ncbi:MAG: ADP-glyceromanno-heptose 6-epimerase [Clostridiales bacterium]|nr:ADP-glyceromanno-heptose 6-epimerase [Clostridiales bacterium]